jgi:hypothetical protein
VIFARLGPFLFDLPTLRSVILSEQTNGVASFPAADIDCDGLEWQLSVNDFLHTRLRRLTLRFRY